jgi:hypothetical protein
MDAFTLQLRSALNDTAESHMRKRAPHVCTSLDFVHSSGIRLRMDLDVEMKYTSDGTEFMNR